MIDTAYQHRLPEKRYPVAVLYLTLDTKDFDVNVHPNKIEIKLEHNTAVKDELFLALQETLSNAERSYEIKRPNRLERSEADSTANLEFPASEPLTGTTKEIEEQAALLNSVISEDMTTTAAPNPPSKTTEMPLDEGEQEEKAPSFLSFAEETAAKKNEEAAIDFSEGFYSNLRILGQFGGMFILAEDGKSLYVIDQHAAHERLLYNRFKEEVATAKEGQPLLVPLELQVNHPQYLWLLQKILDLNTLGFVLEDFGDNAFIMREVPNWTEWIDPVAFLKDLADFWLKQKEKITAADILDDKIIMRACKSAVKANQYLTDTDIRFLFRSLDEGEDVFTCPHGRPITVKVTVEEIKKWFLRS